MRNDTSWKDKVGKDTRKYNDNITRFLLRSLVNDRYNKKNYICFPEMRLGTGFKKQGRFSDVESRIDLFIIDLFPSHDLATTSIEIKSVREDFLKEKRYPLKIRPSRLVSNYLYFCVPKGMGVVKSKDELPYEAGLIEIDTKGKTSIIVPSPWYDCDRPNWSFVASICRRVNRLEMDIEHLDEEYNCMNSDKIEKFLNEYNLGEKQ